MPLPVDDDDHHVAARHRGRYGTRLHFGGAGVAGVGQRAGQGLVQAQGSKVGIETHRTLSTNGAATPGMWGAIGHLQARERVCITMSRWKNAPAHSRRRGDRGAVEATASPPTAGPAAVDATDRQDHYPKESGASVMSGREAGAREADSEEGRRG